MASTRELRALLRALVVGTHGPVPHLVLHPTHEAPQHDDGTRTWGGYDPTTRTIHLWGRSRRLLAHEYGHVLWQAHGNTWPIPRNRLLAVYRAQVEAALLSLEDVGEHYSDAVLEEELFARVFERIYRSFTLE